MWEDLDDGPLATPRDACLEFARNAGQDTPNVEWICTPYDTWERNPSYTGMYQHVDPETRNSMLDDAEDSGITLTEEDFRIVTIKARVIAAAWDPEDSDDIPF